ncbi:hypothetical protein PIB30_064338 [Stylosanthes scabra]|uniref:CP-type G domain-containing protein n=1 Tax=Stylosanthes scabra TaxID=79078 RepID=A0ABU6YJ70_9FABA|nr:hypothetical protein [Stylosanthes scabra]
MAATTTHFARQVGTAVKEKIGRIKRVQAPWYTSLMAAASRALVDRLPLVDVIVEVRDARIPLSSECELLRNNLCSTRKIIALNKEDLAGRSGLQGWTHYFRATNCISCGVDAHNKESTKQLLGLIQRQVRELKGTSQANYTATVMLIGIPNVGKSALANALHQVGRISAAEKGKLRHATVTPEPGETKDIRSFKIGSHPNIFVLDTPGVLSHDVPDDDVLSKLILTGAIEEFLVGRKEIAEYFLAILNSSEQYKKWAKLSSDNTDGIYHGTPTGRLTFSEFQGKKKKQIPTDHTQDDIVRHVRRTLFETVSSFDGNISYEDEMGTLIARHFTALQEAFHVSAECGEDAHVKVARKLLNLFRTGRLGHYILDHLP